MDIAFAIKGIGGWVLTTIPGGEWEDIITALLHLIDVLLKHLEIARHPFSLFITKDTNQHSLAADILLAPQRSRRWKVK